MDCCRSSVTAGRGRDRGISVDLAVDVMAFGTDVRDVDHVIAAQFSLNTKVPAVAAGIAEVRVEQYRRERRAIRDNRRRHRLRNVGQRKCSAAEEVVDGFKREIYVVLFERRIPTCVPKEVPKDTIVETPNAPRMAVLPLPNGPGESD